MTEFLLHLIIWYVGGVIALSLAAGVLLWLLAGLLNIIAGLFCIIDLVLRLLGVRLK